MTVGPGQPREDGGVGFDGLRARSTANRHREVSCIQQPLPDVIARDRAFNDPEAIFDLNPALEIKIASAAYRRPREDGGAGTAAR